MRFLLAALALALCVQPTFAFTLCNGSKVTMEVAVVADVPKTFTQVRWTRAGWWHLTAGQCEQILTPALVPQRAFISVIRDGRLFFPAAPSTQSGGAQLSLAERAFCVSPPGSSFHIIADTTEQLESCRAGEYLQFFNLLVSIPPRVNQTIDLP